ncbi:MAG TPA: Nif3-like dinuclear metal center hexameric protein [Methanocorpusculum sp.]|nr:Nif3-like dinuclear metal center hexameric protein [Methanocorpusculum sp.]HJJ33778.1 Nif3-like dinuclear metal center hexameric protein [Methanocorpusculum sp.]HJJ45355.1 Nif3-like dinuclear metal center hexameric protein [Methanocorpusculum sp.]HJJ58844.1 Nif3-like dinuclear metal center hexameric protein [Methanocorpusculum sp.]HJJ59483.1 Nif3-like dinuclear metal center hexameric protein [Methanocorpusculum sp.]
MKRTEFIRRMEEIAPPELAEEFDEGRVGLLYEGKEEIVKIACALDATPEVAQKAADGGFDALVVHHPAFWNPMHAVTGRAAEILRPLAKADVNLYAMHTNFDHVKGGINDALAELLGLTDCVRLDATPESLGVVGNISMSFQEMAKVLGCGLRVWGDISSVRRIAAAGGAAFDPSLIREAQARGAEAFLASELKYSLALESPIPLIEATHCALEAPGMRALARREGWAFIEGSPKTSIIEPTVE